MYDKNGNRIKKVRTGGTATAVFRDIDPGYNPYRVEVYAMNKLLYKEQYKMPEQHVTYTADLDAKGGSDVGNSGGGSYNLTVKLDIWVYVYDKNGKQVKKLRLNNAGKAVFKQSFLTCMP